MAGEDLLEDDTGTGAAAGKKGKKKPLSKGQKIGLGIGIATILLIIYQVHRQSAASSSSTSTTAPIDPATGYPSGSAQDQAALQAMQGSSASGSGYTGGGSGWSGSGGSNAVDTVPSDLASFFDSLPASSPLSPNYVAPVSAPQAAPTINISVPPTDQVTNPGSTTASQGGASTVNDSTPPATTLQSIIASIDPGHTSYSSGGTTYYGIGNSNDLSQIDAAAKKAGINVTQTNAKAIGIKGGSTSAVYIA